MAEIYLKMLKFFKFYEKENEILKEHKQVFKNHAGKMLVINETGYAGNNFLRLADV